MESERRGREGGGGERERVRRRVRGWRREERTKERGEGGIIAKRERGGEGGWRR